MCDKNNDLEKQCVYKCKCFYLDIFKNKKKNNILPQKKTDERFASYSHENTISHFLVLCLHVWHHHHHHQCDTAA